LRPCFLSPGCLRSGALGPSPALLECPERCILREPGDAEAAFTTFLFPASTTFYTAALIDEVYHLQKYTVARQTSSLRAKNFGGDRALAWFLAWRLAVRGCLLEHCEPLVHPVEPLCERLSRNHAALAATLDRAGALRLRWRPRRRGVHSPRPSRLGGRQFRVAGGSRGRPCNGR
jgi:hypothetical protein